MGLLGFTLRKAWLFDDRGEYLDKQWFSKHSNDFRYKDKSYIIKHNNPTYLEFTGIFFNTRFYMYNVNNPEPIMLGIKGARVPIISSTDFNTILESSVAKRLNDLAKGGLFDGLTIKKALIGIGIAVIGYLAFTGKLFSTTKPAEILLSLIS